MTIKHGFARQGKHATEYVIWKAMKQRCQNPNNKRYNRYGGRGISVCERWKKSFSDFLSDMGMRPSFKHSIDRINNDGNYEPSNCRWATSSEQNRNKSGYSFVRGGECKKACSVFYERSDGVRMSIPEWEEFTGINRRTLVTRIRQGWGVDRATSEPLNVHQSKRSLSRKTKSE